MSRPKEFTGEIYNWSIHDTPKGGQYAVGRLHNDTKKRGDAVPIRTSLIVERGVDYIITLNSTYLLVDGIAPPTEG